MSETTVAANERQNVNLNSVGFALAGMAGSDTLRVVPVLDDRMEPTLRRGDCVLVDAGVRDYVAEGLYAIDCAGYASVYRVEARGGQLHIFPDNKLYHPLQAMTRDDFRALVIGKVLALGSVVDRPGMERIMARIGGDG